MDSKVFFQACQEGDVEKLLEHLKSTEELDISAKDGYGMTALAYAARNGHVEVVRQLLLKGADRTEVLEQGYGRSNAEIARLLEEGPSGPAAPIEAQEIEEAGNPQEVPLHMMNEGNYINGAIYSPQGYPMMPGYGGPIPGQQYYYDGMNGAHTGSTGRLPQQQGHARKESSTGLPPPEVARSIPCRYFPNCRYGEKCIFAHPVLSNGPPGSAPISPSMSPPPMQPMFYQHMPAGYPYPGPYGAGPQFYPSMGPMQPPYGMVAPFNQSMMQSQPPQHSQAVPTADEQSPSEQRPLEKVEIPTPSSSQAVPESENQSETTSSLRNPAEMAVLDHAKERDATGTPPQQDGAEPVTSNGQVNGAEDLVSSDNGKPAHRRQSFNSFLHHHAVPFQPNVLQPAVDMGMMSTMQAFTPRSMGPKNRRTPGSNGTGKRGNQDRPACVFFANRGCRIGDECRFPHILPDGTDARPIQAQQRQMYASAYGGMNPAMRMPISDVPSSAPTGPQAEKKASEDKQPQRVQQEVQQTSQPMQVKSMSQSSSAAGGSSVVVPSIPSKTSTGTSPNNSRASHHKKQQQNHQQQQPSQPAQRVPTVNDFPALAVSSPNIGVQAATTPSPPSQSAVTVSLTSSSAAAAANGDAPSPANNTPVSTANGKRANFSAILSAPAPTKPKAPIETTSANSPAGAEENGHKEDEARSNETQAKTNGTKPRSKESKGKVDSYKSAVISPNKAPLQEDDDFQVVHRSRTSNSNQVKAVAA